MTRGLPAIQAVNRLKCANLMLFGPCKRSSNLHYLLSLMFADSKHPDISSLICMLILARFLVVKAHDDYYFLN